MATAKKSIGFRATGRRKAAIASVVIKPGTGNFKINGREIASYFHSETQDMIARLPLKILEALDKWDVECKAVGGGVSGQMGAVRLGLARALVLANPEDKSVLRREGFLTRDPRAVERKKYGRRKARRSFQFSKR
jgi:small subunit ribosomal protein S9